MNKLVKIIKNISKAYLQHYKEKLKFLLNPKTRQQVADFFKTSFSSTLKVIRYVGKNFRNTLVLLIDFLIALSEVSIVFAKKITHYVPLFFSALFRGIKTGVFFLFKGLKTTARFLSTVPGKFRAGYVKLAYFMQKAGKKILNINRAYISLMFDTIILMASFTLSVVLQTSFKQIPQEIFLYHLMIFTLCGVGVFLITGLHRWIWRYAARKDTITIIGVVTVQIVLYAPLMKLTAHRYILPDSLLIVNWFILNGLLLLSRFGFYSFKDFIYTFSKKKSDIERIPVLVVGTNRAAASFIKELALSNKDPYQVVGLVSKSRTDVWRKIYGIEVLGTFSSLEEILEKLHSRQEMPEKIVVAEEKLSQTETDLVLKISKKYKLDLLKLPSASSKLLTHDNLRNLNLGDILNYKNSKVEETKIASFFKGKRILVTGAAGSVAQTLIEKLIDFPLKHLSLLDQSEINLEACYKKLKQEKPTTSISMVVGSVVNKKFIEKVINAESPDIIFHLAGMKVVPLVEENICHAVLTNVIGTRNICAAAKKSSVEGVVYLSAMSADKPDNVLSALTRVNESLCQSCDEASRTKLRLYPIRLNNILDSSGSVSEAFINQIKEKTIFITHPDIKRNFLMKEDAVKLTLQAIVTASSSSTYKGKVPVITKGVATRIFDLGVKLIRLMGLQPEKEVALKFTGLRLGESVKDNEKAPLMLNTEHKDISMACPPIKESSLLFRLIENLEEAANEYNEKRVLVILKSLVPEYNAMRQGDFSVYDKGKKIRAEDLL